MPATLAGLCLLIFPFLEVLYSSTPLRPGDALWRFGVEGIMSGTIFFPMLGLLFLMAAASLAESYWPNQVLFWVSAALSVGVALLAIAFVFDVLQVKAGAAPRMYPAMKKAAISALLRDAFAFVVFVGYAVGSRRGARAAKSHRTGDRGNIVIGTGPVRSPATGASQSTRKGT